VWRGGPGSPDSPVGAEVAVQENAKEEDPTLTARPRSAGVKVCHHDSEPSFRCACYRFHQWCSVTRVRVGPLTLSCPCGRIHRRGKDGPVSGPQWFDHNGHRKPCPGQEA
jgi:hypothetical protein